MEENILGIKKLTNEGGEQLYPITTTEAVLDSGDLEKTLDDVIKDIEIRIDESSGGGVTDITRDELVSLRDSKGLVPGQKYAITDYSCSVDSSDKHIKSAGHQFGIIVTALDESTLSEDAYAIGGSKYDPKGYFDKCNLSAWKLKYCIDNDTKRFSWAYAFNPDFKGRYECLVETPSVDSIPKKIEASSSNEATNLLGEDIWVWVYYGDKEKPMYSVPEPVVGEDYMYSDEDLTDIIGSITEITDTAEGEHGTGVIYHMEDEYGNCCGYDFKNIMFLRGVVVYANDPVNNSPIMDSPITGRPGYGIINDVPDYNGTSTICVSMGPSDTMYMYTFSGIDDRDETYDISLDGTASRNTISASNTGGYFELFDNVFALSYRDIDAKVTRNTIGASSGRNTFNSGAASVSVGEKSSYNNTMFLSKVRTGRGMVNNTLCGNMVDCSIGDDLEVNLFTNDIIYDLFGDRITESTFNGDIQFCDFKGDIKKLDVSGHTSHLNIGPLVRVITIGSYIENLTVCPGCSNVYISGGAERDPICNRVVLGNVVSDSAKPVLLSWDDANRFCVGLNTNGAVTYFNPADGNYSNGPK